MRTDVERKVQWCLSQAAQSASGKRKRAAVQSPFDPGIRFTTVAVDILGPVTMTSSRAKHVLVLTDLFTMYAIASLLYQQMHQTWLKQLWYIGY